MRSVLSDPNRRELHEEGNLLIEAVSLLVQRQRETEGWIAEQLWQAEERAAASERLYGEFEVRLAGIEEQLAQLAEDVEPPRRAPAVDERLERLREQVEGLRSSADGRPPRAKPVLAASPDATQVGAGEGPGREPESFPAAVSARPVAVREPRYSSQRRPPEARPTAAVASGEAVSFWEVFGPSPRERFGLVLIGVGAVAVLYAILTQLRF